MAGTAVEARVVCLERPACGVVAEEVVRVSPMTLLTFLRIVALAARLVQVDLFEVAHGMEFLPMNVAPFTALLLMALIAVPLVEFRMIPMVKWDLIEAGLEDNQILDGHRFVVHGVVSNALR
jgi:hypothetical protein